MSPVSASALVRPTRPPLAKFLVLAGLGLAVFVLCRWGPPLSTIEAPGVQMRLPETLMGFKGQDQPISEGEKVMLPEDTRIVKKTYNTGVPADSVSLQIVLSGADRRSIHSPEICLPGQGWRVRAGEVVPIRLKSGTILPVMVLDITRPAGRPGSTRELSALYAYWFVSADRETPYHFERVIRTNLDLLFHNKANRWAYVIASAPILEGWTPGGRNRAETLSLIETFIREAVPTFQNREMTGSQSGAISAANASEPR